MRRMVVLLVVLGACGRPSNLGRWDACWHDGAVLVAGSPLQFMSIDPGQGAVLDLDAAWGDVPFTYDTGSRAHLMLDLPVPPTAGTSIDLSTRPAEYMEGGMIESFVSGTVLGTASIVGVDRWHVILQIDARAVNPVLDLDNVGTVDLSGEVDAFRSGVRSCP